MSDQLEIRLFGFPRVTLGGETVLFDRRKALALLIYMASNPQQHSRSVLATMLWPDNDQFRASANLSRTLFALGKAVGADRLSSDRETVGLVEHDRLWVDTHHFRYLLAQAGHHDHAQDDVCNDCLPLLSESVLLARGPFIEGFALPDSYDFEEWHRFESESLRRDLLRALDRLARGYSQKGELVTAIAYARRWAALDPLHEAAHRQLMLLYALSGDRVSAQRQYQDCVQVLATEVGAEPSEDTTRLYNEILAAKLPTGATTRRALGAAVAPAFQPASNAEVPSEGTSRTTATPAGSTEGVRSLRGVPVPITRLVGRDDELHAISELLTNPEVRLLTLTGPPGSGKTRLAIQVAHDASGKFGDGAHFIALETLHDSNLVAPTLVRALGIPESPAKSDEELICAYLQGRSLLLVLDNFEQISDAADLVSAVLGAAPGLKILVTSRTPLHVSGEYEFDVPPLAVPKESEMADLNVLAHCPSVELFVSRAQAAKARFRLTEDNAHAIAQICVRLDGLPLTLELAAARIKVLEPRTLLAQLGHSLDLLTAGTRDRPERQKTLRQALAWSYNLLDTEQQTLLRRLAVFEGGCTVDAVQPVCYSSERNGDSDGEGEGDNGARVPVGPDARVSTILAGEVAQDAAIQTTSGAVLGELSSLVDQSLLRPHADPEGDPRFTMLVTVREYALEQLTRSGEESHVRAAHARFFLALAERAETHLRAPDQQLWMRRLEADIDNLRAALAWAVEQGDTQAGLRFLAALWWFWWLRGYGTEGRGWAERVLSRVEPDIQTEEYAKALKAAGWLTYYQAGMGHEVLAQSYHRKSLEISQALEYKEGMAAATLGLGVIAIDQSDTDEALALLLRSLVLRREIGDESGEAWTLGHLAKVAWMSKDYDQAHMWGEESLTLFTERGDRAGIAWPLRLLALLAAESGDTARAAQLLGESLVLSSSLVDRRGIIDCLYELAHLLDMTGNHQEAASLLGCAEAVEERSGIKAAGHTRTRQAMISLSISNKFAKADFNAAKAAGYGLSTREVVRFVLRTVIPLLASSTNSDIEAPAI